jgi:poly(3-hydroxybutyrate) depolymerase
MMIVTALAFVSGSVVASGAAPSGQFVNRVYRDNNGDHKYVVFVPAAYSTQTKWPVVLYLHGAHSRGRDGRTQLVAGLAPAIKLRAETYPFLVVFPQCENTNSRLLGGWSDESDDADRALKILDAVEKEFSVDKRREILMGASMGGSGVWEVASRTPERWSALVPSGAQGNPEQAKRVARIPVWSFHVKQDPMIPIRAAEEMVAEVRAAGGRAFLSEIDSHGHADSNLAFIQPALDEWLLDPTKDPKTDGLSWQIPAGYKEGLEEEAAFVPGADISRAVQLRVCRNVLDSLAYALPGKMSSKPMAGYAPNIHQSTNVGFLPFDISMSGLQYQGHLERAKLTPMAPDRLLVQLGLRNVTMTIANSQINGKLLISASAGPMYIVIGHRAPVWLNIAVRPRVENRQVRLELEGVDFQIPADNWYVTEPAGVHVRGMPFLNGRVSGGLVDGVYSRKGEIEQQVRSGVVAMIPQMEAQLNASFQKVIPIGKVPMPVWQPRLKIWPEQLTIDDRGLTMILGATIAKLGDPPASFKVRQYTTPKTNRFESLMSGVEVALSDHFIPAYTELIMAGHVNHLHAVDFGLKEFRSLNDIAFLREVIPDLKRHGDDIEANVAFLLLEPVRLTDAIQPPIPSPDGKSVPPAAIAIEFPKLRVLIATRRIGERKWQPCAEVDLLAGRDFELTVLRGRFSARALKVAEACEMRRHATGRFAAGYEPETKDLNLDPLLTRLVTSLEEATGRVAAQGRVASLSMDSKDLDLIGVPLRLENIERAENLLIVRQELPGILVTNSTTEPFAYEVRGPFTEWGRPRTIEPGQSHEYRVPYPLTWRRRLPETTLLYTLPLGREASCRDTPHPGLVLVRDELPSEKAAPKSVRLDGPEQVR